MLQELIACPNPDHGALVAESDGFVCQTCGARFETRNGIPVLLPTGEHDG